MYNDPIIEDLHKIREQIATENNNDLHAIVLAAKKASQALIAPDVAAKPISPQAARPLP